MIKPLQKSFDNKTIWSKNECEFKYYEYKRNNSEKYFDITTPL